jgi:hypothetical protein
MENWWIEHYYVRFGINNKNAAFRQDECPYRQEKSTEGNVYIYSKLWQSLHCYWTVIIQYSQFNTVPHKIGRFYQIIDTHYKKLR